MRYMIWFVGIFFAVLQFLLVILCFIFCFYWILVVLWFIFTVFFIFAFENKFFLLNGFNFLCHILHLYSHTLYKWNELFLTIADILMFSWAILIIAYYWAIILWIFTKFSFLRWYSLHLKAESLFFNIISFIRKTGYCKVRCSDANFGCRWGFQEMSLVRFINKFLLAKGLSF